MNPAELISSLDQASIETAAPCRIDMGGTLDIATLHLPLAHLNPLTFNIALHLMTRVRLTRHSDPTTVRISSTGFDDALFALEKAPFNHPMGLFFAIAAHFNLTGIHIRIDSASPPRSALGGSSAAAVALIGAYGRLLERSGKPPLSLNQIVRLAHAIEESAAGTSCGTQDQLAAAFGGINAWYWQSPAEESFYRRAPLLINGQPPDLTPHLLIAYTGVIHSSHDINGRWLRQFIAGDQRAAWHRIIDQTHDFVTALTKGDFQAAGRAMQAELDIRRQLTPDVLDEMGVKLAAAAKDQGCGARFCGAGGGGCLWALGPAPAIQTLRAIWRRLLAERPRAGLLPVTINHTGLFFGP